VYLFHKDTKNKFNGTYLVVRCIQCKDSIVSHEVLKLWCGKIQIILKTKHVYLQKLQVSITHSMTVNIFIPCIVDQIYPQTAVNMEKILNHFGIQTHYVEEQTCCGQFAYKNGFFDQAQQLGEKFIKEFNNGNNIVMPAVSCAVMVRKYYPKIFYNSSQHNDLKQIVPKTFEFTDFLYNIAGIQTLNSKYAADVCIHTSCSGLREYGVASPMQKLISTIDGVIIHPLKDDDVCCGFGGTFSIKNPSISAAMAKDKLENAIDAGAQYIISDEASCLMHLKTYASKQKLPITPIHIIDFIALVLNL